ncbi:COG2068 Uncharacterized MobA-related protein [Rhabdaerophilaceae bacterium]
MQLAALILAAGRSTRFEGGGKLLALLDGRSVLSHVLAKASDFPFSDRVLVVGHRADEIGQIASDFPALRVIQNPNFATGLVSSLRVGIASLASDTEAAIILLGDMPLVSPLTLKMLTMRAQSSPDSAAFIPSFRGEWGNPVLLRRQLFAEIEQLSGDQGARALLKRRTDCISVPVDDPGILADIDTHEALLAMTGGPNAGHPT